MSKPRGRGWISHRASQLAEFSRKFRHCHIWFFGDAGEEKRAMRIKLGMATSAARPWGKRSGRSKSLHQPDSE
jgi:hypothetical protein